MIYAKRLVVGLISMAIFWGLMVGLISVFINESTWPYLFGVFVVGGIVYLGYDLGKDIIG